MPGRREPCRGKVVVNPGWAVLAVALLCGLMLSGCGDFSDTLADLFRIGGKAEAQGNDGSSGEKQVQTFRITADSFLIDADLIPRVDVTDSATRYEMLSDATLSFTPQGGSTIITFDLNVGDIVVERPGLNLLTVVTDRGQF